MQTFKRLKTYRLLLIFALVVLHFFTPAKAQDFPDFSIVTTSGKVINSKTINKPKPLVLIYFAPDCDHCIKLMEELVPKINGLKGASIVMVTFKPADELKGFEKKFKTASYKNMIVGIEQPIFFLRNLYKLETTPFTAVYDKSRRLVKAYKKETPVKDLLAQVKKLQ